jgi:outer membrane receptor protein involved in Fe transport
VVTRTFEGGVRGTRGPIAWNADFFHADNHNDILFVASQQSGFGYFKNFGKTRRQGIELGLNGRRGRLNAGAHYTWLDATFQSPETIAGAGNSTNDAAQAGGLGLHGDIDIEPGNHIPLIPRHIFKAFADVQLTTKLALDVDVIASSGVYARGNENNAHEPDGVYYLGPGTTPAYDIVNLGAHYDISRRLEFVGQVNNLFNTHYYTASQLQGTGITPQGTYIARPFPAIDGAFPVLRSAFYAPGAPTMVWVAAKVRF